MSVNEFIIIIVKTKNDNINKVVEVVKVLKVVKNSCNNVVVILDDGAGGAPPPRTPPAGRLGRGHPRYQ